MLALHEEGKSYAEIGKRMHCTRQNVAAIFKQHRRRIASARPAVTSQGHSTASQPGSRKALKAGIYALTEQLLRAAIPIEP